MAGCLLLVFGLFTAGWQVPLHLATESHHAHAHADETPDSLASYTPIGDHARDAGHDDDGHHEPHPARDHEGDELLARPSHPKKTLGGASPTPTADPVRGPVSPLWQPEPVQPESIPPPLIRGPRAPPVA